MDYNSYERFIWDKGNLGWESEDWQSMYGSELVNEYEDAWLNDAFGDPVPQEIKDCYYGYSSCKLDHYDPYITIFSNKSHIYEGSYNDLDWAERVYVADDYTETNLIVTTETEDNVNYDLPGSYIVIVEAVDLAGNKSEYSFYVTVEQHISGC